MLPETKAYVKCYGGITKWIHFLIERFDDSLEKYNTIWDKVSADINKDLKASLPIVNFFLKPK